MLTALTEKQKTLIINNVVAACGNIDKLNSTGYKFINIASGFIAHYDMNGFKDYYRDVSFRDDVIDNARNNMWTNFREGDRDFDYYMAKADVYKRIIAKIQRS